MITVCGENLRRSQLPDRVTQPVRAGRFWAGIPHRRLADTLIDRLESHAIEVLGEKWSVIGTDGARMVGAVECRLPSLPEIPGQRYGIAIASANDLSRAIRMSVGTEVMVCHNGIMTGEFTLTRKHTVGLIGPMLELEVDQGVQRAMNELRDTSKIIKELQGSKLPPARRDQAFMEIGRQGILPWSGVGKAWRNYIDPPHDEFKRWDGRAWAVYQATNQVVKDKGEEAQIAALVKLTQVLRAA